MDRTVTRLSVPHRAASIRHFVDVVAPDRRVWGAPGDRDKEGRADDGRGDQGIGCREHQYPAHQQRDRKFRKSRVSGSPTSPRTRIDPSPLDRTNQSCLDAHLICSGDRHCFAIMVSCFMVFGDPIPGILGRPWPGGPRAPLQSVRSRATRQIGGPFSKRARGWGFSREARREWGLGTPSRTPPNPSIPAIQLSACPWSSLQRFPNPINPRHPASRPHAIPNDPRR